MKIIVLGCDGYLGEPMALYLASKGHDVVGVDNYYKRQCEAACGVEPLLPIPPLAARFEAWVRGGGKPIRFEVFDLQNHRAVYDLMDREQPDAIIHFAEQPSAPYSMMGRYQAVETQVNNVVGTMNVLFAMQKHCPDAHLVKLGTMGEYGTPNIEIEEGWIDLSHKGRTDRMLYPKKPGSFYHACYDDQTEVLTESGWKRFADLIPGERIATRPRLDHKKMVYEAPTRILSYDYDGPIYRVKQRRLDIAVTPNHRMVTSYKRRDGSEAMRFEYAEDIHGKCNRYHVTAEWEGVEIETYTILEYKYLDGGHIPTTMPAVDIPMDAWLLFLGWYLAEGCISPKTLGRKRANRICISQKPGAWSDQIEAACRVIAEKMNITYSKYENRDDLDSHWLFSTQLCQCLAQFGGSYEKFIPRQLLSASRRQLRILFDALMDGDGHWYEDDNCHGVYHSNSKQLANDVQEIAIKLGLSANLSVCREKEYRVNICDTESAQVNQSDDTQNDWYEDYHGTVYCCEVPGDGIMLVRRNGKPVWCGNSKVHDSTNIEFACRAWGMRATDLNQGVVYGTVEGWPNGTHTSFHYDAIFGTALNRFIAQAVVGEPITVYGGGDQTRGFLNIRDTLRCVELACENPADRGEFRVFNQFTEQFSVNMLARLVANRLPTTIAHIDNPRVESEKHFYQAENSGLLQLGLQPHLLDGKVLDEMIEMVSRHKNRITKSNLRPYVNWKHGDRVRAVA